MKTVHKRLNKFPTPGSVEVRDRITDLGYPENGATSMYVGGMIYLFPDRRSGWADARDTLFHELFHLGWPRFLTRSQYISTMPKSTAKNPCTGDGRCRGGQR